MDWGPIATAAVSAFTGIVGAFFTWLAVRPKAHADAGRTHADSDYRSAEGFRLLVQELRLERVELAEVIERQGAKIEAQSEEITRLRGEVATFKTTLDDLLARWRRGDEPPPPEPKGNR